MHEGIYVVQEVASCFHCGPPPILAAIAGAEVAEECHGRVDLRLVQRPQALFRVREKRSAVAVGVGVSVPADLEGGASGWGAPSPAMLVAVCDGGPSEGRRLQRLDARRLLVAHDEGAVA